MNVSLQLPKNSRLPKYALAEQAILGAINGGAFAPGTRIPAERALADSLGISYLTARRAVCRLVEQGILQRHSRQGTFVAANPRCANVALAIFDDPLGASREHLGWHAIRTLRRLCAPGGHEVRVLYLAAGPPAPAEFVSQLRSMQAGALGLMGSLGRHREFVTTLSSLISCVLLNEPLPGLLLPCAAPDMAEAGRMIVAHLAARKRRRLGMCIGRAEDNLHAELAVALQAQAHAQGMSVNALGWHRWAEPGASHDRIVAAVCACIDDMIGAPDRPDALVLTMPEVARHLATRLEARGEFIGREMDVVVVDDGGCPQALDGPWAVLDPDYPAAIDAACSLLLDALNSGADTNKAPVIRCRPILHSPQQPNPRVNNR